MIKKMIKWFNSLNEIDRELAKQGIFNFHTMYGTFTYTDKALTTHINSNDDNFDCGPNFYKGALAIDKGKMYHFYRQDENGMWSHKDGGLGITNLDYSGNKISDPKYSDTGRYTEFCSYFCVPKNEYSKTNMSRNNYRKNKLWYT